MFNFFKKKKEVPAPQETLQKNVRISIVYSYEWKDDVPLDKRDTEEHPSRPFCKRMMELRRIYTAVDIEKISMKLGYSVFDRCGGDGCRHVWKSNIHMK
jgi:hypothetical protein